MKTAEYSLVGKLVSRYDLAPALTRGWTTSVERGISSNRTGEQVNQLEESRALDVGAVS
jgi:hypothetical protein